LTSQLQPDIEWSSDKAVFAAEILDQLTEGLRDRGIRKVFVLEAAAALLTSSAKGRPKSFEGLNA